MKDNIIEISNMLEITSVENILSKLENLSKNIKESNYPRVLFELCLLEDYDESNKQIQKSYRKQKSIMFLYSNNDYQKIKKTIPFMTASKK